MRSPYDVIDISVNPDDWRTSAACLDMAPEVFFPVGGSDEAIIQLQNAKRVCAACPVQRACLRWAESTGISHGVWGGLSEAERKSLKRRAQRQRQESHA